MTEESKLMQVTPETGDDEARAMADAKDLIRRMAYLIEGALEDLDEAAKRERLAEASEYLRKDTKQRRAENAYTLAAEAADFLFPGRYDVRDWIGVR